MRILSICLAALVISPLTSYATAIFVDLGTADNFAVLAGTTVTNTATPTVINGNLGVWPGSAITGFGPGTGTVNGTIDDDNPVAMQAEGDLTTAYNFAAAEPCGTNLSGMDLGGMTLMTGVYCFNSSAGLTGILTLNAMGNPNAVFVIQIDSSLTTGTDSSINLIGGAQGANVFWQVGSSATLGTGTAFEGNILALTSISLTTGATIGGASPGECGSALASNGAVTLDNNTVSVCTAAGSVPEPSTGSLLVLIGGPGLLWLRRLKSARG
jgi:Ice-binding-like